MKKFLVTILAVVYLTSSNGATIYMHYCMGSLADWGLNSNKADKCGKCGMELTAKETSGCCKDELRFFKNDTDQKTPGNAFQSIQSEKHALPVTIIDVPSIDIISVKKEKTSSHAPPRMGGIAVYIRNRTFLL